MFDDFQKECMKTAIYPDSTLGTAAARSYCFAGLASELGEMFSATSFEDKMKEGGDVLWYLAALAYESQLDFQQVFDQAKTDDGNQESVMGSVVADPSIMSTLSVISLGKIGDALKKNVRDDNGGTLGSRREKILESLAVLYMIVISFATVTAQEDGRKTGPITEYLMRKVLDKLSSRAERGVIKGAGDNR